MFRKTLLVAATGAMSACALGPEYSAPSANLAARFANGGEHNLVAAASEHWWRHMHDGQLTAFVTRGLTQNLDIDLALERIREASAAAGRSGLNAQLDGDIQESFRRSQVDDAPITETRSLSADAEYVFDIFGGVARGRQQAVANIEAATYDLGTVRLAFEADIVSSYIRARYFQSAARITQGAIENRRRTLSIANTRLNAGEATELEVQQARALVATAEASLPVLIGNFEAEVFSIATLLAEPAGPLLETMRAQVRQPRPAPNVNIGVPADLLRNRPDIHAAERALAASVASIGVAEAQLYPSFSLNGTIGAGSSDTWSFGPTINLPVLGRGVLKANRNVAITRAEQAETIWRQTVLGAVEDVQSAQALTRRWQSQVASLNAAVGASDQVLRLARQSYQGGAITLDEVLDAERQSFDNRLALSAALREYALSWVQLQVATGRGWLPFGTERIHAVEPKYSLIPRFRKRG